MVSFCTLETESLHIHWQTDWLPRYFSPNQSSVNPKGPCIIHRTRKKVHGYLAAQMLNTISQGGHWERLGVSMQCAQHSNKQVTTWVHRYTVCKMHLWSAINNQQFIHTKATEAKSWSDSSKNVGTSLSYNFYNCSSFARPKKSFCALRHNSQEACTFFLFFSMVRPK